MKSFKTIIKASLLTIITMFLVITKANALTIIETTKEDEYDNIANNTIILGVTKFEPNVVLTAGKTSLATYNDYQFNKNNPNYKAPKIYYYLQGSWYEIDNDNNVTVIKDEKTIEELKELDIFYVNNNEKTVELKYAQKVKENYELVFTTDVKEKNVEHNNGILKIPTIISNINVSLKDTTSQKSIEIATITKDAINSVDYKIVRKEITGEDGLFTYIILDSGKIQITRYLGSDTSIVIPAEYDGYTVYSIGNKDATWSKRYNIFGATNSTSNSKITNVVISEGIEVIETAAFSGCSNLTGSAIFPSTLKKIGDFAFNNCKKLTGELQLPEGLTFLGDASFQYCSGLTGNFQLPSTLTKIGQYSFNSCSGLTGDLKIPNKVTIVEKGVFQNMTGLKGELTIPEGVTNIQYAAFSGNTGITGNLLLPSTLEEIGDFAFNHLSSMTTTTLTIPKSVKTIGTGNSGTHIFYDFANNTFKEFIVEDGNKHFKSIDGVLLNKEGTRLIGYPSSRIGEVYEMPEGVTIIDELGFSRAGSPWHLTDTTNKLKKLILPNSYVLSTTFPDNYINTGNTISLGLYKYTGITNIEVKEDNPNYKSINGVLYSKDGTILWYVPIRKSGEIIIPEGVTTIKAGTFYGPLDRSTDQTIKIPSSVTHIDNEELGNLKSLGKNRVTFDENCIYEFKSNGTIGKKS